MEETYNGKDWFKILVEWADENNISEDDFPRDKQKLLAREGLMLDGYNLSSIPEEIGNLTNLVYLMLFHNTLTYVPPEIGNLPNLKILNLGFNKLKTLPDEIGKLQNLKELYLNINYFETMPSCINELKSLKRLDTSFNQIETIPEQLLNRPELEITNVMKKTPNEEEIEIMKKELVNLFSNNSSLENQQIIEIYEKLKMYM